MCAWDRICRFPGETLRWTLAGQRGRILGRDWKWGPDGEYGGVFGWKKLNGPRLGNPDRVLVRNYGRPLGWGNRMEF